MVLASMLKEAGDQSRAISVLRTATRRFPNDVVLWLELGNLNGGSGANPDPAEAVRCFRKAVEVRPRSHAAAHEPGHRAGQSGQY